MYRNSSRTHMFLLPTLILLFARTCSSGKMAHLRVRSFPWAVLHFLVALHGQVSVLGEAWVREGNNGERVLVQIVLSKSSFCMIPRVIYCIVRSFNYRPVERFFSHLQKTSYGSAQVRSCVREPFQLMSSFHKRNNVQSDDRNWILVA